MRRNIHQPWRDRPPPTPHRPDATVATYALSSANLRAALMRHNATGAPIPKAMSSKPMPPRAQASAGFLRHHRQVFSIRPVGRGVNRLTREESVQFLGQRPRRWVAARRLLTETLEADRGEVFGHARVQDPRRDGFGVEHRLQFAGDGFRHERRTAGQQKEENRAQGVDITLPAGAAQIGSGLFWWQEIRGSPAPDP